MKPDLSDRELDNRVAVLQEEARHTGRLAAQRRLVAALVDDYDLLQVAADACAEARIPEHAERVAYCLAVLCQKADPPRGADRARTYELDVYADGFALQLRAWADTVARNLAAWSTTYEAIQDEFDRFEIGTLQSLIGSSKDDDVVDVIADRVSAVIAGGPRLAEMSLALARDLVPSGAEYVFQTPLARWVNTSARRRAAATRHDPLETPNLSEISVVEDDLSQRDELRAAAYRQLSDQVAKLATTTARLPDALAAAEDLQRALDRSSPSSAFESRDRGRLRAELAYVIDELQREQRAFGAMLAYVLLAMQTAPKMQKVAVLSLRRQLLGPAVVDHIRSRMLCVVESGEPPTPALITKSESAGVPARRARELLALRDNENYRARRMLATRQLLESLPPVVNDVASIGRAIGISAGSATSTRRNILNELSAIDPWMGRVFRRYAMPRQGAGPIARYVARVEGDERSLTAAIADGVAEHAARTQALLLMLRRPDAAERARAARAAQRMRAVTPPVAAQLAWMATSDSNRQVRGEAAAALRKLGLYAGQPAAPVDKPGEPTSLPAGGE